MEFIKMTDQYMELQMRECKINRLLNVWSEIRPYKNTLADSRHITSCFEFQND